MEVLGPKCNERSSTLTPKDRLREHGATAAELRLELQRDIEMARAEAKEIVSEIHRSHTRAALIRWGAAGVVSAAALFGAGLWIGVHYLR